jgi:hypothetical protein
MSGIIRLTFVFIALYYLGGYLVAPMASFADALRGFEVIRYSESFGTWNRMYFPNPHIPDELLSVFVSWWTPGQYQWPALFMHVAGNWSNAIALSVVLALASGVWGWARLWKFSGFPHIWILLLILILHRNFYWHILLYMGGDVLLFAVLPHFFMAVLRGKNFWIQLPFWLLIGFWAKASFILFALPAVIMRYWSHRYIVLTYIRLLPAAVVGILLFYFYLQPGETPSGTVDMEGYVNLPHRWWNGLIYSFSAPFAVNFWGWSMAESLWKSGIASEWMIYAIFIVMTMAGGFLLLKKGKYSEYQKLSLAVFLFIAVFFTFQQSRFAAISFEARHFYPVALLTLPLLLNGFKRIAPTPFHVPALIVILTIGTIDCGRFYPLKQGIAQNHCLQNKMVLPVCSEANYEPGDIIVTDTWNYLPAINSTHKLTVEVYDSSASGYQFRVLHGIESDDRPVFSQLGTGKRKLKGVFFTMKESEIRALLQNWNIISTDRRNSAIHVHAVSP